MAADNAPMTTPIPEPPGLPFLGNSADIDRDAPLRTFMAFAEKYGEIFQLRLPGRHVISVNTHALVNEVCDEKRFHKDPSGSLEQVRHGVHDGLFTARPDEENWGIAHRVLMPAFGPVSIRGMFDEMHDIATQLTMKWARFGPNHPIAVSEDFTRLTLDTLALCSMGYRFNSYYTPELHPFVAAMGGFLVESGRRNGRAPLPAWFYRNEDSKYWADIEVMRKTANDVLKARKDNPSGRSDRKDLLQAMLDGVDPKTKKHMTDQSIIDNLITFLIAGHETTSGMLSFAFYQLLKHPEAYRKAQQEVDEVIGKGPITVDHLPKLHYINALLREVLRLNNPIPQIIVRPKEDTLLGGKYPVKKGDGVVLLLAKAHLDPAVYGEDANEFRPERMLDENFNKLPPNAWKPFGNGIRGCIGRPFAWQEALLVMAMLLQNFNFIMDDPSYNLQVKQTLTIKPNGFYMRAVPREDITPTQLEHRLAGEEMPKEGQNKTPVEPKFPTAKGTAQNLTILYGSNSGTCEALAQRLADDASDHGFTVSTVDCMDVANGRLPKGQPVVIITASYEGLPPDNAGHFVQWLEDIKDSKALNGVQYAVFGCGHHDWVQTFHRVPKLVDSKLEESGARRLVQMGLSDAGKGNIFSDFESWEDEILWPALNKQYKIGGLKRAMSLASGTLDVSVSTLRTQSLRQDVKEALVRDTRTLTAPGEPIKKHMELQLPSDMTYRAGDYLAILPFNPKQTTRRAMRRFNLPWDSNITINSEGKTAIPSGRPISAYEIFSAYVELAQPATKRNILALAECAKSEGDKQALKSLATQEDGSDQRASVLDLLEKYASVDLPIGAFLGMLPPMRVRQYSISSSPLENPNRATITFSVLNAPSHSGPGRHIGVATSFLNSLEVKDKVHVAVRPSPAAFHLPSDSESTPIICVAAGTGLAPFRGFMQERAAMLAVGRRLAPALLFVGCRAPELDDLYADELAAWEEAGAMRVFRAYSRDPKRSGGAAYVQDAVLAHREEFERLWEQDARMYICGSQAVGNGVRDVVVKMRVEAEERAGRHMDVREAEKWWEGLRNARYATDVFD